jgi:oligoribonuclease
MCPLAGNSIYMDRMFLRKYMPLVNDYLHYRNIDISSIKELTKYVKLIYVNINLLYTRLEIRTKLFFYFRRWQPDINKTVPKKEYCHRAMFDLQDSLNELHYYRKHFFAGKENIKFDI